MCLDMASLHESEAEHCVSSLPTELSSALTHHRCHFRVSLPSEVLKELATLSLSTLGRPVGPGMCSLLRDRHWHRTCPAGIFLRPMSTHVIIISKHKLWLSGACSGMVLQDKIGINPVLNTYLCDGSQSGSHGTLPDSALLRLLMLLPSAVQG